MLLLNDSVNISDCNDCNDECNLRMIHKRRSHSEQNCQTVPLLLSLTESCFGDTFLLCPSFLFSSISFFMVIAWPASSSTTVHRKVLKMWPNSSSTFVGINRESETALQSMGQYIEDYIDLVENVPNDIVRGITQFHEKNHVYHQLLDRLEKAMEKAVKNADDEPKRKQALFWIQKYLVDIQVLADEKLQVGQSIYEQLEFKARQLDHDIRAINIGSGGSNLFSPIKSRNDSRGTFASQFARGQAVNNSHNTSSATVNGNGNVVSEESQDSSTSPDQENGHEASKEDTPSGKRVSKKRLRDEDDDDDKESESPIKDTKRARRIKSRKYHEKHSSNQLEREEQPKIREEPSRRGKAKASSAKNGSSDHPSKTRRGHRDTSPPSVYDEPSPLDPDEPTYCVCQQISFGEMIGCDNSRCPIEWFHFSCVGLSTKPKGKWYCPSCRGERSNIQRK